MVWYGFKLGLHQSPTSLPLVQLRRLAQPRMRTELGEQRHHRFRRCIRCCKCDSVSKPLWRRMPHVLLFVVPHVVRLSRGGELTHWAAISSDCASAAPFGGIRGATVGALPVQRGQSIIRELDDTSHDVEIPGRSPQTPWPTLTPWWGDECDF